MELVANPELAVGMELSWESITLATWGPGDGAKPQVGAAGWSETLSWGCGTEPKPGWGLLDGAKPQVDGQLSELCDVFSLDRALHDCLEHFLEIKSQVSKARIGLFSEISMYNSLS